MGTMQLNSTLETTPLRHAPLREWFRRYAITRALVTFVALGTKVKLETVFIAELENI